MGRRQLNTLLGGAAAAWPLSALRKPWEMHRLPIVHPSSPVAAFTGRHELKAYLRRRLDTFINPLVYTFWGN